MKYYESLEVPIGRKLATTMAAPRIVFKVYGIANPIRFSPKIKIAPASGTKTKITIRIVRIDMARIAGFPFAFSNILKIDFILYYRYGPYFCSQYFVSCLDVQTSLPLT